MASSRETGDALRIAAVIVVVGVTACAQTTAPNASAPLTPAERFRWFARSTIGASSLASGVFSSAIGTARRRPEEYGPTWAGFGQRYGIRLSGIATQNAMEAGLGALWGEDPRYFRLGRGAFRPRVRNVIVRTFLARRAGGDDYPAYARYIALPASNFLANAWRPQSEADTAHAVQRTILGLLGRMGSDAFLEFWPDARAHLFKRH